MFAENGARHSVAGRIRRTRTRVFNDARRTEGGRLERVYCSHAFVGLTGVQVLGIQDPAAQLSRGSDYGRVPVTDLIATAL